MSVSSVTVTSTVGPFLPRSHRRSTTTVRSNKISVGPTRLLTKLKQDCATPLSLLHHVADAMSSQMRAGLSSDDGPGLPMMPTYVHTLPSGNEKGLFYALDLGGTNFRVLRVQLGGKDDRVIDVEFDQVAIPHDLMFATSEELFDFIALGLAKFVDKEDDRFHFPPGRKREIGFTFSFPVKQTSIDSGILIKWTKGFAVSGTVGRDVVACLNEALERQGLDMRVSALVNDTVGTLAGAEYYDNDAKVAVILGTGTNACYIEKLSAIPKLQGHVSSSDKMIISTEWGAFSNGLPLTVFDREMDAASINPGHHIFEKTISGMYLGEIVRRVLVNMAEEEGLFGISVPQKLSMPFVLGTPDLSAMQQDNSGDLQAVGSLLYDNRRCRTGRKHSDTDPLYEERSTLDFYVPRDEAFAETKQTQFNTSAVSLGLTTIIQSLDAIVTDINLGFENFEDIEAIYKEGFQLPNLESNDSNFLQKLIPKFFKDANDSENIVRFDTPEPYKRDRFFWFSDVEFARETLAGANPYSIQLVKEWPLKSKLDAQIYGPPESAITREIIESQITIYSTVEEAIKEKKLFMLDYHDFYLPYVSKLREIEGTTLYGSRTLFYLTSEGILKPLAIELTRPPIDGKAQWKQVFTPNSDSTNIWLWRLAKAHVLVHDSGHHELISHWLRTHCVVEPIIIATHRQLSSMHPIFRLLHPHLRYTMEINKVAREVLINASGLLEISFFSNKYTMELSSVAYDNLWQFDLQALPNDLINRGMAVEDPNAQHGVKLIIEDYPFANDGLLIWDAIKQWITEYVNHYYPSSDIIESDQELQAWWTEIRTVGHADKSEEPWWPNLKTQNDLINIITTIAWTASAHHSAVNFTQYAYIGFFPNRPTIARKKMPTEDPTKEEWEKFMNQPEQTLLECFPSKIQATLFMIVMSILSEHSPDEEYIGQKIEPSWGENSTIKAAFEKLQRRLNEIEGIIDSRNEDRNLKNRNGAGIVPYESLKPFSGPGVTGKGVPYSISI